MKFQVQEIGKHKNFSRRNNNLFIRLNNVCGFLLFAAASFFIFPNIAKAQNENLLFDRLSVNLKIQNMHLWHGSVVTPGAMMASSIEYTSSNEKLIAGLWGGASFNGQYKEFSYYTTYHFTRNFDISLISHNNYSNSEEVNIFSYDKHTSPNFVDIVFQYTVSDQLPLKLCWSTILFGNGGDFKVNKDNTDTNSYSNYVELSYTFFSEKETSLKLFAGGAFSFVTEKTFYSNNSNITNLGVTINKKVNLLSNTVPVLATAFWNPETKLGALLLSVSIF